MFRLPSGTTRRVIFALLPTFLLFLVVEFLSLEYFFRQGRPEILATHAAIRELRYGWDRRRAQRWVDRRHLPDNVVIFEELYGERGRALLAEFQAEYAEHFALLAAEVERIGARLLVVYVPPTVEHELALPVALHDSAFLRALASRHAADFHDLSAPIMEHALDEVSFAPFNLHLTRFGNKLIAGEVAKLLRAQGDRRSSFRFDHHPELLGDLPPSTRRVWEGGDLPFVVQTNSQGLRMRTEVASPKGGRQRVLLLGDSFTFGYNVDDRSTYPAFLASMLEDREIINAGVPGYSIPQETSLFLDRAKYCEPDVVVLQVLFNDLFGLFSFERDTFARDWNRRGFWFGKRLPSRELRRHVPSQTEREFVRQLTASSR